MSFILGCCFKELSHYALIALKKLKSFIDLKIQNKVHKDYSHDFIKEVESAIYYTTWATDVTDVKRGIKSVVEKYIEINNRLNVLEEWHKSGTNNVRIIKKVKK